VSRASLPLFAALLLLISGTREASAQASPPSYGADCPSQATAAADVLRDAKTYGPDSSNALHCYARAAARAAAEPDAATEAAARLGFATAAYSQSLYAAAGADAKTARAIFERLGDLRGVARAERLLGTVAGMSGDRAEARRLLTLAREAFTTLKMDQDLARVLLDLERVEDDRRSSLDLIEASLKISRAIGAIDLEGSALHQRADWKFADGKFDEAITDLNAAIERFSRQPETRIELSNAYVSLGRLLRAHGRPAEAIEYYDRAAARLPR